MQVNSEKLNYGSRDISFFILEALKVFAHALEPKVLGLLKQNLTHNVVDWHL